MLLKIHQRGKVERSKQAMAPPTRRRILGPL